MQMIEKTVNAERIEQLIDVFGSFDENIKRIESEFGVRITNRGTELKVQGDIEAADQGARALEALLALAAKGEEIDEQKVRYIIHTDFERGFIAAEVVHYDDLVSCGGKAGAREHGKLRIEGKEYVVKDGDVIEFRFNV